MFFISGMPIFLYMGKHWLVPKSCLKDGGVPKSPCSCNWQPWCPSAGTLSIDVGSYRGCYRHPKCTSVRQWPERLGHRAINRSIEEEHRVQVLVRDNNVDQALRVLKKKMQREGLLPMKPRAVPGAHGRGGPARVPRF